MGENRHITEFLPAYALHCLDVEETVMVSEHLAVCQECRQEFETLQMVTDHLALAVPQVEPRSELKTLILKKIQPKARSVHERSLVRMWWQQLSAFWQPGAPAWSFASAAIIVLLVINTFISWQRINSLERLSSARDFQVVTLNDTQVVPEATGQIVISHDGEIGALTVARLPVLEPGYTYQVWLIDNGQQSSGGTFMVNQQGYGMLTVASTVSLLECEISITIEPLQGSPEPTGETVLHTMI
jgi:anti-sigma-K factor RskA